MTRRPTVEWQVCGVCNYDCSYCIQSKVYRVGHPSPAQVEGFLGFFGGLAGRWEIKMTGGEPFAFKGFMERIVPGLVGETTHTVSVLTNLSAPWSVLERFARLTRGRLGIVSASLHLEHCAAGEFADKARRLRAAMDPEATLVVNSVLVPGRLAEVQDARATLAAAGLTLYPQIYKVAGGVHAYDGDDQPLVDDLVGIAPGPRRANLAPSYRGRMCWSGVEYFVLLQDGEAWSCRTARRHKAGRLGNVLDGSFRLAPGPLSCAWDICPCAVPANRGMIEGLAQNPTPRPEEGVVSWNINTACNYRCTYCTQRFKEDRGRWSRDTPRFLQAFARLPGRWEIKLSGGEPFVHPTLDELVAGLAALGHRVSVVTNFSAGLEKIERFVRAARGRVGIFSCSLHLEYVDDLDAFIAKARTVAELLVRAGDPALPAPHLCVTSVATRAALPRLPEIAARFAAGGVVFKVQPEKQDREVIAYADEEASVILRLGGHNLTGQIVHGYAGRPCWAGSRYFILDDEGTAYRCYPARRFKIERMGSFLDAAFTLADRPSPCLYRQCNCTVPIARRMMPRDELATTEELE